MLALLLTVFASLSSWAKPKDAPPRQFLGPDHSEIDLLRPVAGGSRIFVQGELPDGSLGLFLVDTGADISVLTEEAAERIGLDNLQQGEVWGLSGTARVQFGQLPSLQLGDMKVFDIDVAVGVPGFSDKLLGMPLAGLLGNNVWSRFVLELDYPADLMVLHAPGAVRVPRRASKMVFDNAHVYTQIEARTPADPGLVVSLMAQVDTGASELTLCAANGVPFQEEYTQGLETVRGIGASDTLPPFRFLEMTRRIPLRSVRMGGAEIDVDLPARWMAYDDPGQTCGGGMTALIGHEYLSGHRVWFDYAGGRLALRRSRRPKRLLNGHAVLYDQEIAQHGNPPERGLYRAELLLWQDKREKAVQELATYIEAGQWDDPEDGARASVLLARILRTLGRHDDAWALLESMAPGDLVDQNQAVGMVNGLLLANRPSDALRLAKRAVEERPDEGWAQVALADVMLFLGQYDRAHDALVEAARLEQYKDAHLLRRARVALASGDRYGSMAHVRRLLDLYPSGGPYLWFYAMLLDSEQDLDTFRVDLEHAMSRLHPHTQPYDFLVAAHHVLGNEDDVRTWLERGLRQHCDPMKGSTDHDNCVAWYLSLAGRNLDDALTRIDRALAKSGERADYLDTKAMVHLAREEYGEARRSARHAARLSPDDVYMLWQAERIAELAANASSPGRGR